MSARWFTFLVWAAVAATAVFWTLKLVVKPAAAPLQAAVADGGPELRSDLTRLLGAEAPVAVSAAAPEPAADARFNLVGVVSPRAAQSAREGVALIAVDGKPARAYRVGAVVDGQTVLQSVQARGAELGPRDGPTQIALKLTPPAAAAVGSLPPAGGLTPAMPVRQSPTQALPSQMQVPGMAVPPGSQMPQPAPPVNLAPMAVPPGVAAPNQAPPRESGSLLK